jgi:[glutamine synthetase] adenylyltransferase / [glutamine synthetase]-adenylyl-L-tyrosine phosphorylase
LAGRHATSRKILAALLRPRLRPAPSAARKARLAELGEVAPANLAAPLKRDADLAVFLASVMEVSPFLRPLILDDPARLARLLSDDPEASLRQVVDEIAKSWQVVDEPTLMSALRRARQEVALLVAFADLGGVWDMQKVTSALSDFADAAISASARFILAQAASTGAIALADAADPARGSGWVILGMGKLGACELNYSSDIDLIVLFDAESARTSHDHEPAKLFVDFTRRLIRLLSERTEDGHVFRTDLRLRPDPGATNIAISTEAALNYYESLGQNWERAALIKARPVASDIAAGDAFLAELTPYIWRKYLDFAAIDDIHSIKRQIHDFRGHEQIAVAGHNIKLGRGGIREIEFFVQTQHPELRGRSTLGMLTALAEGGWIDHETSEDLSDAYVFLRMVEHALQMLADEQTHSLPEGEEELGVVARMCGFAGAASFGKQLTRRLETVRDRYAALFEHSPALGSARGSLVFTGDTDDPETLATLARLGFANPADITRTVRSWHFGRYPAMRSAAARERLTEFFPALIEALAGTESADRAFMAFDRFLSRLPAGVQLFALLGSNRWLLALLATMLATAPRLADTVVQRAHVLDALLEPAFFGRVPDPAVLEKRLAGRLAEADGYEEALDQARIFGQEQAFLIGVRVLAGTIGARQAGQAFTDLADVLIAALLATARKEFEATHGKVPGGEIAVLALGKLGGREMTAASDLDLIVLYDFDDDAGASDGPRPLPGAQYFTRLTQRLLAALSAPTAEGSLYEVDFRLRPSGKSGPLATHIDAFTAYQAKDAWTWEHMALTRARPVAGDRKLVARAGKAIAKVLARKRDPAKVATDVIEMRKMVEEAKGGEGAWDLKQAPGGLVDIEFVAQYLQLIHGRERPEILSVETGKVLAAAAEAGVLPPAEADTLVPALALYQSLTQILRLCVDGVFRLEEAPSGLLHLLARAAELPDFATLDRHLRDTETAVRASFQRIIGG